jgi:aminomethyltransferase
MSAPPEALALTPLDGLHRRIGARMGGFAGYDMPIQYPLGLKAEHLHTRNACGIFDVSHMGQVRVTALDGSWATLNTALAKVLALDFQEWPEDKQKYSFILNQQGGIEDDLMALKCADEIRLVLNAGNKTKDLQLLRQYCPELQFELLERALIAVQGPAAQNVMQALDTSAASMTFMTGKTLKLFGADCLATRSGYTGEDGWEISLPAERAQDIVEQLLSNPLCQLVGLGARDTLRLEAGLPLHGNDVLPTTTPIEASLGWAIPKMRREGGAQAGGFVGSAAVLAHFSAPPKRKLVGLRADSAIPVRAHAPVLNAAGTPVGEVTSGTVSPSLGCPIMLAYVDTDAIQAAQAGGTLAAQVRQQTPPLTLVKLPFVEKRYKR